MNDDELELGRLMDDLPLDRFWLGCRNSCCDSRTDADFSSLIVVVLGRTTVIVDCDVLVPGGLGGAVFAIVIKW